MSAKIKTIGIAVVTLGIVGGGFYVLKSHKGTPTHSGRMTSVAKNGDAHDQDSDRSESGNEASSSKGSQASRKTASDERSDSNSNHDKKDTLANGEAQTASLHAHDTSSGVSSGKSDSKSSGKGVGSLGESSVKPVEEAFGCFTETFHHKDISSHEDGEACLHHQNLIKLAHNKINSNSVCVRVNGTPVKYKSTVAKNSSITIGALAGPQAEISVRYCTGKISCKEDCTVPKDEFLSSIGGEDDSVSDQPSVKKSQKHKKGWNADADGAAPGEEETALKDEMDQLNKETQGEGEKMAIFKDWIQQRETPACKEKLVSGR